VKPNSGSMGLRRGEKRPSIPSGNAPALKWTEALTLISETHAPDDVDEEVRQYFSEVELVNLTTAIVSINCWNRVAIGFRSVPGTYEPKTRLEHAPAH